MYSAEISRANPTAFLLVIDQSGSMADVWGGGAERKKAEEVADALNKLLYTLVMRSSKGEPVYDYFHVGVLGYGSSVGPCLTGPLAGARLVPVSEIASNPARLESRTKKVSDGAGGLVDTEVRFPVWVEPVANGGTPMCEALRLTHEIIADWTTSHPLGYPPTIIHVTDGESTDGDPSAIADEIKHNTSQDGPALLFNIHISSLGGQQLQFPDSEVSLPDDHARLLFRMSSMLPESIRREAEREGFAVSEGSRGFAFNADLVKLIQFLDIGTRASNLR